MNRPVMGAPDDNWQIHGMIDHIEKLEVELKQVKDRNVEQSYEIDELHKTLNEIEAHKCKRLQVENNELRKALEQIANQSYRDAHKPWSYPHKIARKVLERS